MKSAEDIIRFWMYKHKKNISQTADAFGLHRDSISSYLNGKNISPANARKIEEATNGEILAKKLSPLA